MSKTYTFSQGLVWDINTLTWVKAVQTSGGGGASGDVNVTNESIAVTGPLTNTELRASAVPISGTVTANAGSGTMAVSGPLTDAQLRNSAVPVSGTFFQATQPVSGTIAISGSVATTGPLTDTQLRNSAVPVSGTVTATGPLTDTQLRATAVPVSGTFFQGTQPVSLASMPSTPVTGTFWQSTQPVSLATAPVLVAGSAIIGKTGIDQTTDGTTNKVYVGNIPHVVVDTAPTTAVTGPLTDTQLRAVAVPVSGTVTATGPLTDTQLRNSAVPVSGTFWQTTQPMSATILPLPTGASTDSTLGSVLTELQTKTKPADQQHVIIDTAPTITAAAIVDDSPSSNLLVGSATALSLTTDGRLRVASVDASVFLEQFRSDNPFFDSPALTSHDNPWAMTSPWD